MTMFDRFNIGVVAAAAGMCGVAIALSPGAAAAPLITGGYECFQTSAGEAGGASPAAADGMPVAGAPAAAGGLPVAGGCIPASAPLADMAGIPMALPGPVPVAAPVPLAAPAPLGAPVPVVAPAAAPVPLAAPVPEGAPLLDMSGGYGGKGDPIAPPSAGAPVSGQPIPPGPAADGAR